MKNPLISKNEHMPIELESLLIYNPFDAQAKKN